MAMTQLLSHRDRGLGQTRLALEVVSGLFEHPRRGVACRSSRRLLRKYWCPKRWPKP